MGQSQMFGSLVMPNQPKLTRDTEEKVGQNRMDLGMAMSLSISRGTQ